jgi:predicted GIY-YIG superfamily endonuclease
MIYVYWIHLESYTDHTQEGYIGISKQPVQRYKTHLKYKHAFSKGVRAAIEKYGINQIKHSLLFEFSTLIEARKKELELRPSINIGWNLAKGGGVTPDVTGRVHSNETRQKISNSNITTKAETGYIPNVFKGKTDRHSDEMKKHLGSFHKGKIISDAHKKAITEKLSGGKHPVAKSIRLYHVDNPTNILEFDCIKTAADKTGINYSNLRSMFRLNKIEPNRKGWAISWG